MTRSLRLFIIALTIMVSASAAVIDFGTLGGPNSTPYFGHTQNGFTVTPTAGTWFEAHVFGSPAPDIYGGPNGSPILGTIEVTGGLFTFSSADLAATDALGAQYTFRGFLGLTQIFSTTGSLGNIDTFSTYSSPDTVSAINRLEITLNPGVGVTSFNIDNIVVNAVPEPSAIGLVLLGGVTLLALRRGK